MGPEAIEAIGRLVTGIGFPAATAVVLLWWVVSKLNGKIETLCELLQENTRAVDKLCDRIEILWSHVEQEIHRAQTSRN